MRDPNAGARAALGSRCRQLIESETFQQAIAAVDHEFREAMFRTKPEETEKREALYHEYKGLQRVLGRLKSWEQDGVMANRELDQASGQS